MTFLTFLGLYRPALTIAVDRAKFDGGRAGIPGAGPFPGGLSSSQRFPFVCPGVFRSTVAILVSGPSAPSL